MQGRFWDVSGLQNLDRKLLQRRRVRRYWLRVTTPLVTTSSTARNSLALSNMKLSSATWEPSWATQISNRLLTSGWTSTCHFQSHLISDELRTTAQLTQLCPTKKRCWTRGTRCRWMEFSLFLWMALTSLLSQEITNMVQMAVHLGTCALMAWRLAVYTDTQYPTAW